MPVGYKHRKWMAYLLVSASGPEFSPIFEEGGRFFRCRMAADLRYTTADVDYLESHFKTPHYDSGDEEYHQRLRNPTCKQFFQALQNIQAWLKKFRAHPDWDGGGFELCFAGHGRQGDGALVLNDGLIKPDDFMHALTKISSKVSLPGRLRISAVLDSCHSGAFILELLNGCFHKHNKFLVPFDVFASCMDDEYSYEESGLGHGLFTYCISIRQPSLGSVAGTAIQPDNSFGPSLAIASGTLGCSLLTAGVQNPISYQLGGGLLDVCGQHIDLFEDGECISLETMCAKLRSERYRIIKFIRPMRVDMKIGEGNASDEDMRDYLRNEIKIILTPLGARKDG